MKQATSGKRTGIQWTLMDQLEDLDFADHISLLSHIFQDAQDKLNCVSTKAAKTGLNINIKKKEVMRINNNQATPVRLHQQDIKEVDKFVYLGSVVSKNGGADEDIQSRINKARYTFNQPDQSRTQRHYHPITRSGFSTPMLSLSLWIRNMECNKKKHEEAPNLCQQMPQKHDENQMAWNHYKQTPLEPYKPAPSRPRN